MLDTYTPEPEMALPLPQEVRKSFRVGCLLPVWYRPIPREAWPQAVQLRRHYPEAVLALPWVFYHQSGDSPQTAAIRGDILNISAGGVLLRAKQPLAVGQGMELALQLPNLPQPLGPILARVGWVDLHNSCQGGLEFVNLPEIYREHLVSFIFKHQRQLRRQETFA